MSSISQISSPGNFLEYSTKERGFSKVGRTVTKNQSRRLDAELASIVSSNVLSQSSADATGIQRMQQKIAELDLANPQFKRQIQAIQQELKRLKPFLDGSTDLSHLERTLALLIDHTPLKVSAVELELIGVIGKKYNLDNYQLATYMDQEGPTIREAKSVLLKRIKENSASLQALHTACKDLALEVQTQVVKERCKNFCNLFQLPLNHHFPTNFYALVHADLAYRERLEKDLHIAWKAQLASYDSCTNNQFSRYFSNHSAIDLSKGFSCAIKQLQERFFQTLDFDLINQLESDRFILYLTQQTSQLLLNPFIWFVNVCNSNSRRHLWIIENIQRIKKSYCQTNEIHTNLGGGVCYNNCLFRYAQIENTPLLPSEELLLGSNEKTRYRHVKYRTFQKAGIEGRLSQEKQLLELNKLHFSYGLKSKAVNVLERHTQAMLNLNNPSAREGHTISLQCDSEKGIYRFIDDNFGLVEFESPEKMGTELQKYLQAFYPELSLLIFECFDAVGNEEVPFIV